VCLFTHVHVCLFAYTSLPVCLDICFCRTHNVCVCVRAHVRVCVWHVYWCWPQCSELLESCWWLSCGCIICQAYLSCHMRRWPLAWRVQLPTGSLSLPLYLYHLYLSLCLSLNSIYQLSHLSFLSFITISFLLFLPPVSYMQRNHILLYGIEKTFPLVLSHWSDAVNMLFNLVFRWALPSYDFPSHIIQTVWPPDPITATTDHSPTLCGMCVWVNVCIVPCVSVYWIHSTTTDKHSHKELYNIYRHDNGTERT
jgi:hypothetical protein